MKNYSKISLVFLLLISTFSLQGQRIGFIGGLNIATMNISGSITSSSSNSKSEYKKIIGHHIGIISEFPFSEKVSLQTSIIYSIKGSNYEYSYSENYGSFSISEESSQKLKLSYLDIPINLKIYIALGKIRLYGSFGPYFSYGIAGSWITKSTINFSGDITTYEDESAIDWGNTSSDMLKRFDFGIGYGLGFELNNFQIGVNYSSGIANINPVQYTNSSLNSSIKNNVIQISFIYFFGNKKPKVDEEISE